MEKALKSVSQFFNRHRMLRGMVAYSVLWPGKNFYWKFHFSKNFCKCLCSFWQLAQWFNKLWQKGKSFLTTTGTKFWGMASISLKFQQDFLPRVNISKIAFHGKYEFSILSCFHDVSKVKLLSFPNKFMQISWKVYLGFFASLFLRLFCRLFVFTKANNTTVESTICYS